MRYDIYRENKRRLWNFDSFQDWLFYLFYFRKTIIMVASLLTLPVFLVYNILDDLDAEDIFLSAYNVCTRLNSIIDSYHRHPYQVKRKSFFPFVVTLKGMNADRGVFIERRRVTPTKWQFSTNFFCTTIQAARYSSISILFQNWKLDLCEHVYAMTCL